MKRIRYILVISFILVGCIQKQYPFISQNPSGQGKSPNGFDAGVQSRDNQTSSQNGASNLIAVYFSDPQLTIEGEYHNGPEKYLVEAINHARISVDLAIYNLNLWSIRDALINALHRGLMIRIVMESDNLNDEVPQELEAAGVVIVGDRREGLMHNKFMIIDRQDVWTGSMNHTIGSAYFDNNNLIYMHSEEVAEDYLKEFDEMYVRDMFGPDVIPETPHPLVEIGGNLVEIYFSPDDHIAEHIIELINSSNESIYFMAYSFTENNIGSAIIEKFKNGIFVTGLMDESQIKSNIGTEYDPFLQAGISVITNFKVGLMHHKVIIIDRKIVISGSYNFSNSAETKNDENVVVIHSPEIAYKFLQEFNKISARIVP